MNIWFLTLGAQYVSYLEWYEPMKYRTTAVSGYGVKSAHLFYRFFCTRRILKKNTRGSAKTGATFFFGLEPTIEVEQMSKYKRCS